MHCWRVVSIQVVEVSHDLSVFISASQMLISNYSSFFPAQKPGLYWIVLYTFLLGGSEAEPIRKGTIIFSYSLHHFLQLVYFVISLLPPPCQSYPVMHVRGWWHPAFWAAHMKRVLSLTLGNHMCAGTSSVPEAGGLCQKTLGKQQGVIKAAQWLIKRTMWAWDLLVTTATSPSIRTHTHTFSQTESLREQWAEVEMGTEGAPCRYKGVIALAAQ